MIGKRLSTTVLAVVCVLAAHASPAFATKRLAAIASAAGLNLPAAMAADACNDTAWAYKGRQLRVCTNAFGEVSHIGYCLFDRSLLDSCNSRIVQLFVERYALELDLRLDKRDARARMAVDKVVCGKGNVAMLAEVTPQTPFTMEEIERRMHRIKWNIGDQALSLTIPADCQLIIGADAIELEDIFERNLKRMQKTANRDAVDGLLQGKRPSIADQFIINGGEYLNKLIRSDLYIVTKNGENTVMIDRRKPVHSVSNILLTGIFDREIPMRLTVNRYGYHSTRTDVTLQQFVNLCREEGCRLYVGIKEHGKESVKATVFALNGRLAYNHVLSVEFPLALLDGGDGRVEATAYVYIPLQNVTEKFFTQDLKDIKLDMK